MLILSGKHILSLAKLMTDKGYKPDDLLNFFGKFRYC